MDTQDNPAPVEKDYASIMSRKDWLDREILESIEPVLKRHRLDMAWPLKVGLVINGQEVPAELYNDIMRQVEAVIDREALELIKSRYDKAADLADQLVAAVQDARGRFIAQMPQP